MNTWTVVLAAFALVSAMGLAMVARRCVVLKQRVADLTTQLESCGEQLEIFTSAMSEDLQAPLRELHRMGREAMQLDVVDLGALAREVVDALAPRYPRSNVTILDMPSVRGDRALLRRVWTHLVENALKFSASAQSPKIEIGGRAHDREVEVWVRDNGAGFDMAHRHRLFEVFQRLHTADEFAGTGTGLAMVRLIVKRHGGNVRAQAKPGGGATFTVILPNVH